MTATMLPPIQERPPLNTAPRLNGSLPPPPSVPAKSLPIPTTLGALLDELAMPGCAQPDLKVQEVRRHLAAAGRVDDPASEALEVLARATVRLRWVGGVLTANTLGLLLVAVTVVAAHEGFPGLAAFGNMGHLLAAWSLANLLLCIYHEAVVRHGSVVFLEVSDELNWYVDGERAGGAHKRSLSGGRRPPIETRITLRNYGRHADLPLVPGHRGSAVYALVSVLLPLCVWGLSFVRF